MDDAFIMNTTFLNSFPPFFDIGGEGLLHSRHHSGNGGGEQLGILCKACGDSMIEIEFRTHYRIVCDNDQCYLFRERQGSRAKEIEEPAKPVESINRLLRPSYSAYLEERRQNYHLLRNLGISSTEAPGMTSRKQTRIYLEQNGYQVA